MTAKVPRLVSHNAAPDATAWLFAPWASSLHLFSLYLFIYKRASKLGVKMPIENWPYWEGHLYQNDRWLVQTWLLAYPVSCVWQCFSMLLSFPHVPVQSPPAPSSQPREGQREKRVQNQESLTPCPMAHLCLLPSSFGDYSNSLNKYFISSYIVVCCILI